MRYLLGYDIGSSSVKASLVDAQTGGRVASAFFPKSEAPIKAVRTGWAEQNPADWWSYLKAATAEVMASSGAKGSDVAAIKAAIEEAQKAFYPAAEKLYQQAAPQGDPNAAGAGFNAGKPDDGVVDADFEEVKD